MQRRSKSDDNPRMPGKNRRDYVAEALQAVAAGADALAPGEHASRFAQGTASPVDPNAALAAVKSGIANGPHTGVSVTGDNDLDWLIDHESGNPETPTIEFSTTAKNKKSTAAGLGQLLKGNREAYARKLGVDPNTTDFQAQKQMMELYVKDRYGTPAKAKAFWEKHGWY